MSDFKSSSVPSVSSVVSTKNDPLVVSIHWANHEFDLHAERAVHWKAANTIIIADPHFGKAAAFRAAGVPVPSGTTHANLDRLTSLVNRAQAQRLIVLGDFLHAHQGRTADTMNAIADWRSRHADLEIILVRGNHDQHAGDPPSEWNIHCVDEPFIDEPFAFVHVPSAACGFAALPSLEQFTIAGHVHPCAILRDVDGSSMRVPCFHVSSLQMILPAFGAFTGTHPIRPVHGDRIFAVSDDAIAEIQTIVAR